MTIERLKALVIEELDSRELKSRARYSALDKIVPFIKNQYGVDATSLPASKEEVKLAYADDSDVCGSQIRPSRLLK